PAQAAIDSLCADLHLTKSELVESNTDSVTRDRAAHLADIDRVVDASVERIETAQTVERTVADLRRSIERISAVPAIWTAERRRLDPIETRRELAEETGVRSDYLLEYADGRRAPTARRTEQLLAEIGTLDETPDVETVQRRLRTAIESLCVPYERVADGTDLRGTDVINLLKNDDHDFGSL
ncbi:MAG: Replication factor C small subunit, partial [Halobaculum sp.]